MKEQERKIIMEALNRVRFEYQGIHVRVSNKEEVADIIQYKLFELHNSVKSSKPILVEKYADNGKHSHWELIDNEGNVLWSEISKDELLETTKKLIEWNKKYPADSIYSSEQSNILESELTSIIDELAVILSEI